MSEPGIYSIIEACLGEAPDDAFLARVWWRLCRQAHWMLGSGEASEEARREAAATAAFEALGRAWQYRESFENPGNKGKLYRWLCRIGYHVNIGIIKRRSRILDLEDVAEPIDESTPAPEWWMEHCELTELLSAALAELEPELRNVFLLKHAYDLKYKEIAEILQIAVGTAQSRRQRAKVWLRNHPKLAVYWEQFTRVLVDDDTGDE